LKTIIFILLLIVFAGGIRQSYSQYGFQHNVTNYLPLEYKHHYQNWQSVQDEYGVMYFANGDGILIFDGENWDLIMSKNKTNIMSLTISDEGQIYYGAKGEVGYLDHHENGIRFCHPIPFEQETDELNLSFFWKIYTEGNRLVVSSDTHWLYGDKNGLKSATLPFTITKCYYSSGLLWGQTKDSHIFNLSFDSFFNSAEPKWVKSSVNFIISGVILLNENRILIASGVNGLFYYDLNTNTVEKFQSAIDKITDLRISDILKLENDLIAISTDNKGLYIINQLGAIVFHCDNESGLTTNKIRSVFEDRENLIWVNTDNGISKVHYNEPYTSLTELNKTVSGVPNAIKMHNDILYIATTEGIGAFANDGNFNGSNLDLNFQTFDLASVGSELYCANTHGIYKIDTSNVSLIATGYARALLPISTTYLVTGGRNKLTLLQKKDSTWMETATFNLKDEVLHLEQDPTNNLTLWAAFFSSGTARIAIDTITHSIDLKSYNLEHYNSNGYILPFSYNDTVRFAPKSSGLFLFDTKNEIFYKDRFLNGLLGDSVNSWLIKEDLNGILFVENSGPVAIIKTTNQKTEIDTSTLSDFGLGYVNDLYCDSYGVSWFACDEGIVRFDPKSQEKEDVIYYTLLNTILVNNDSIILGGISEGNTSLKAKSTPLDYQNRNISFSFSSPQFTNEKKVLYSYMLNGYDQDFSSPNKFNKAIYTNLNPGEYCFLVHSINEKGIKSKELEYYFTISKPWYLSYWAYLIYFILFILLIYILIYLNSIRLKSLNNKLKLIVEKKTTEIRLNRDELSIQKNKLEVSNREMIDSIHYAKRLQRAILPSMNRIQEFFSKSFIYFQAKDIVAGDFYWFEKGDQDGVVYFAVADCTGHGVPGALVSVVCSDALNRALYAYNITKPNEILDKVNTIVIATFNDDEDNSSNVKDGMDISFCKYEYKNRKLSFSGAHNSIWILSKNRIENAKLLYEKDGYQLFQLKADRQPVGSYYNVKSFNLIETSLTQGDKLYLFTDGIIDQFGGEKGKKFKRINFYKLLFSIHLKPMKSQGKIIREHVSKWKGSQTQTDDLCVLGIEIE